MTDPRLVKKWKAIEIQLTQAAEFLEEPQRFALEQKELTDHQEYLRANEFELAMDELAQYRVSGAGSKKQRRIWGCRTKWKSMNGHFMMHCRETYNTALQPTSGRYAAFLG